MRISWIDCCKGIGIIFVTLGHTRVFETPVGTWITSFHMPLFFVMAGLCFDERRYASFGAYFVRKCKALMYPYFMLCLFIGCLLQVFCFDNGTAFNGLFRVGIWRGFGIGPMWFIVALFFTELLSGMISQCVSTVRDRLMLAIMMTMVGYGIRDSHLPLFLSQLPNGLFCIGFYWIGWSCRPLLAYTVRSWTVALGAGVALSISVMGCWLCPERYVVSSLTVGNPFWFYAVAVCGTLAMALASIFLDRIRLLSSSLQWLGKNSMAIFCFHGACGLCANTWSVGAWTKPLEYCMLVVLVVLTSKPLRWLIVFGGAR